MIASRDADGFAGWIYNRLDLTVFIQLEKVAVGRAGSHTLPRRNAARRHFEKVSRNGRPTDSHDRPLVTELVRITAPQDLCRTIRFRLQRIASRLAHVGEAMPCLGDVHARRDDAIKHDSTDFVCRDRFDGDADATAVFLFGRFDALDGCVANEAGQLNGAGCWVSQWRVESNDAPDGNGFGRRVMNTNG